MIKPVKHIESIDLDGKEGVHYEIIDENENDIPDGAERKNEGEEISDYDHPEASTSKSILESGRKLIAGENLAGKIGGKVKDVLKRFVPLGEEIDSVTDQIGDSLKTKPKINTMATKEKFFQKIIRFLKQPSTRDGLAVLTAIIGAVFALDIDPEILLGSLLGIVTGIAGVWASVKGLIHIFKDEDA